MKNRSFLVPAMIVRFGEYVSFDRSGNKEVEFSEEPLEGNYVMAQEVGGEKFVCKLRSNEKDIDSKFIKNFFNEKAQSNIDKAFKLKIKDALESDDDFNDKLDKIIEEKDLSRKESKEFEKTYLEDKIEEIALNEKLIGPGSMVRLPLSSSKEESVEINGEVLPVYESLCLIMKGNGEISESGIYYVSQNRHGIPLRLRPSRKNDEVYYWETNNDLITEREVITLLNHGVRTADMSNGFYLYFRAHATKYENEIKDIVATYLNEEDPTLKKDNYKNAIEDIKNIIEDNKDAYKDIIISLPSNVKKAFLNGLENTVISKQPMAITNLLFKNEDKEEKSEEIQSLMNKRLGETVNGVDLYGIYSIISTYDALESDTYGFLINNLKPGSVMFGLNDYVEFIDSVKSSAPIVEKKKTYGSEYLNSDLDTSGMLDI